jgi:hypothetical protein
VTRATNRVWSKHVDVDAVGDSDATSEASLA